MRPTERAYHRVPDMSLRRFALLAALPLAVVASAADAVAEPVSAEVCLSTNDRAQTLRSERKLREAREQLKVCSQTGCPTAVQRDCSRWLGEVDAALPTLSFAAKDPAGGDLTKVRIAVDGHVLLEELDGSAIPVDPGKHTFTFDHEGDPTVTRVIVVTEGDKARKIDVAFGSSAATPPGKTDPPPATGPKGTYSAMPFVLAGIGTVALVGGFVFMADRNARIFDECKRPDDPGKCGFPVGDPRLDEATSLKNQSYVGLGIGIGGAVALAGGITWFVIETVNAPKSDATARLRAPQPRLTPVLGLGYAGLGGSF